MKNVFKITLLTMILSRFITAFRAIMSSTQDTVITELATIDRFLQEVLIGKTVFTTDDPDHHSERIQTDNLRFNVNGSMISIYIIHLSGDGEPEQGILMTKPNIADCRKIIDTSPLDLKNSLGVTMLRDMLEVIAPKAATNPQYSFMDYGLDEITPYIFNLRMFGARIIPSDETIRLEDYQKSVILERDWFNQFIQNIRTGHLSNFVMHRFGTLFNKDLSVETVSGVISSDINPEANYAIVTRIFLQGIRPMAGHYVYLVNCVKAGGGSTDPYFLYTKEAFSSDSLRGVFDFYENTEKAFCDMLDGKMINSYQTNKGDGFRVKQEAVEQWLKCLKAEQIDRIVQKQHVGKTNEVVLGRYILDVLSNPSNSRMNGSGTAIVEALTSKINDAYGTNVTEEEVYKMLQIMITEGVIYSSKVGSNLFCIAAKTAPVITVNDSVTEEKTTENKERIPMVRRFAAITISEEFEDTVETVYCHADVPEMDDIEFQRHLVKKLERYRKTRPEKDNSCYRFRIKEVKTIDIEALIL